jgi:hypothetical protein
MVSPALTDGIQKLGPPTPAVSDMPGSHTADAANRRSAAILVVAVWTIMAAGAIAFVAKFGGQVPFWDDWNWVPLMTGDEPLTLSALWQQNNEHRMPLPKLIQLKLYDLTGFDFRAPMFFNAIVLAGLALALVLAARVLRGKFEVWDALLPMALLHWGHYESLLISTCIAFVLPTAIAGIILVLITRSGDVLSYRAGIGVGVCLLLLTLCAASGLALVPALALWLGYAAVGRWRSGQPRQALVLLALAAVAVLMIPLYFSDYKKPYYTYDPSTKALKDHVRTAVQVGTVSLGPAVQPFWPSFGAVVLGVFLVTVGLLGWAWWRRPAERLRAAGLLLFLGAVASLALGMGWGRSSGGDMVGFQSRYTVLAVPALCGVYFTWLLYGPASLGCLPKAGLFTLVCSLLALNTLDGLQYARDYHRRMDAFEADLRGGVPPYLLLRRHGEFLFWSLNERLEGYMQKLHRAKIAPFDVLRSDPPFTEVSLPVKPVRWQQMEWLSVIDQAMAVQGLGSPVSDLPVVLRASVALRVAALDAPALDNGRWLGTGEDPSLDFSLPRPRYVAGIRITYSYPDSNGTPLWGFRLYWKGKGQADFTEERRFYTPFLKRTKEEISVLIWVGETIDQFRLHPDNERGMFRVKAITLLVPRRPARPNDRKSAKTKATADLN